jgi:2,3,4,5-tetrahydropyridine-2-carboxylate N-succinyltransferase
MHDLESAINTAWNRETNGDRDIALLDWLLQFLKALDDGRIRVCSAAPDGWVVHEWVKKGILLCFRFLPMALRDEGVMPSFDRLPLKCQGWNADTFKQAGFRSLPGAIVRRGAYVAPNVVLMPSFVNIGAWIGESSMIDSWATVGSCAQIGARCHISSGVGIGGVLEPLQSHPTIIEDDCFIGAQSQVAEGVVVERGSVIAMGVSLGASTKIVDRANGEMYQGRVPCYSVVVPGSIPSSVNPSIHQACAVIVKRVDEQTRSKTSINALLRFDQ